MVPKAADKSKSVSDVIFPVSIGIGYSLQDLLGNDKISLETSVSETGLNTVQG